tara:strand:- start:1247 stop:2137 length:891 start_codon:yes stop_codon:yes gene_type:complete
MNLNNSKLTKGHFLVLTIIALVIIYLFIQFISFEQNNNFVFIRDDTRAACLYDVISGKTDDPDTAYFGIMAALSNKIYSQPNSENLDGWVNIYSYDGNDFASGDHFSGLHYAVWKNDKDKVIALIFRGTDEPDDIHANLYWITKYFPFFKSQYEQIPDILKTVEPLFPVDFRVISAGHSLGGGLAQLALYSSEKIRTAYVFNTTSVTGWSDLGILDENRHQDPRVKDTKVYRINEYGDGLQFLRYLTNLGYMLSPQPNIHPYFIEYRLNAQKGGLVSQHSIQNIVNALNNAKPCDK